MLLGPNRTLLVKGNVRISASHLNETIESSHQRVVNPNLTAPRSLWSGITRR